MTSPFFGYSGCANISFFVPPGGPRHFAYSYVTFCGIMGVLTPIFDNFGYGFVYWERLCPVWGILDMVTQMLVRLRLFLVVEGMVAAIFIWLRPLFGYLKV